MSAMSRSSSASGKRGFNGAATAPARQIPNSITTPIGDDGTSALTAVSGAAPARTRRAATSSAAAVISPRV